MTTKWLVEFKVKVQHLWTGQYKMDIFVHDDIPYSQEFDYMHTGTWKHEKHF